MDLGLNGKVAWVLGGSSGLGRGSARALHEEGVRVAISARGREAIERTASDIGADCIGVPCDVSEAASIIDAHRAIVEQLGPIDILVSNGGGPPRGRFENFDDDALYGAFTSTTAAAWRLAKAVLPGMKEKGGGTMLFITSSSTKEVIDGLLFSNMMRAAVVGMAKTLSKELGSYGIRVACVSPGRIQTPRVDSLDAANAKEAGVDAETARQESIARIPLGRYGDERELGAVVAFLASEQASYVSGTNVLVDGGMLDVITA